MKWYFISFFLSIVYTLFIFLSKTLNTNYLLNSKTIFINSVIIASIFCIIFYPKEIMKPTFDFKYLLLIVVGISIFSQNYLLQLGTGNKKNMGVIDGLAIAIYLPLVTFILCMIFKQKINLKKKIAIVLIALSSYLILS
jgi:drug/metabolite transporter (DMT)-like permease